MLTLSLAGCGTSHPTKAVIHKAYASTSTTTTVPPTTITVPPTTAPPTTIPTPVSKFTASIDASKSFVTGAANPYIDFTVTNVGNITRWAFCNIVIKSPTYARTIGYNALGDIAPGQSKNSAQTFLDLPSNSIGVPTVTVSLSDVSVACGWPNAPG
jgi:hypothetical protein